MIVRDTVQLALRNLRQSKLRTGLTTLGVAIGIASLAGMVSLGVGLQEQFVGRFTQSGLFDSITVVQLQTDPRGFIAGGRLGRAGGRGFNGIMRGRRGTTAAPIDADKPPPPLDDDAIATLSVLPDVKEVYPTIRVPVEAHYGQYSDLTVAAGVPMSARNEGAFQTFTYGSFFPDDSENTCLLSLDTARSISEDNPGSLIGKDITLSYATSAAASAPGDTDLVDLGGIQVKKVQQSYRVVGIVERQTGPGLGGAGVSNLMLPLKKAREIDSHIVTGPQALLRGPGDKRPYNALTVKVKRSQSTQDVEDRIKALGYSAFSINDALQGAKRAFILLDIVLSLIGSIALAVSSLGIVNTMVMSILERTREIGVMKAIGGSDADIRSIFLVEASAIGVLGGVTGVILGWIVGRAINFGANIYIQNQGGTPGNLFSLPLWLIAGAIAFSWVVSLLAGSYPASRAARLDPIQALRHD
jgi:putative ABC transport system permease protein